MNGRPKWLQDRFDMHEVVAREAPEFDQEHDIALVEAADLVLALAACDRAHDLEPEFHAPEFAALVDRSRLWLERYGQ